MHFCLGNIFKTGRDQQKYLDSLASLKISQYIIMKKLTTRGQGQCVMIKLSGFRWKVYSLLSVKSNNLA